MFLSLVFSFSSNVQTVFAFTEPSIAETEKIVLKYGVSFYEAKRYLWGLENQKREKDGLSPIPIDGKKTNMSDQESKYSNDPEKTASMFFSDKSEALITPNGADPGQYDYIYVNTPFYSQETPDYCGPASTKMALSARNFYTTPWGSSITQSLLANDYYLETDSYGYTIGSYIKWTLNTIMETDFYVYLQDDDVSEDELIYRVRLDLSSGYVPILAIWQRWESEIRLNNYPYGQYEIRHFIPVYESQGTNPDTAIMNYCDPVSGWGGKFINVQPRNTISVYKLARLNSGGSIIY